MKRFETLPFLQPDKSVAALIRQYNGAYKNNVVAGAAAATFLMSDPTRERAVLHEEFKQLLSKEDFAAYEDVLETLASIKK